MRSRFNLKQIYVLGIAGGVLIQVATGCGTWNRSDVYTASPSSYQLGATSSSDPLQNGGRPELTDYRCPSASNILPINPQRLDGSDEYQACSSLQRSEELMLFGQPHQSDESSRSIPRICVFPIDTVNESNSFYKKTTTGAIMHSCKSWSSSGMKFSFPATQFNALLVVPETELNATLNFLSIQGTSLGNIAQINPLTWPASAAGGRFR